MLLRMHLKGKEKHHRPSHAHQYLLRDLIWKKNHWRVSHGWKRWRDRQDVVSSSCITELAAHLLSLTSFFFVFSADFLGNMHFDKKRQFKWKIYLFIFDDGYRGYRMKASRPFKKSFLLCLLLFVMLQKKQRTLRWRVRGKRRRKCWRRWWGQAVFFLFLTSIINSLNFSSWEERVSSSSPFSFPFSSSHFRSKSPGKRNNNKKDKESLGLHWIRNNKFTDCVFSLFPSAIQSIHYESSSTAVSFSFSVMSPLNSNDTRNKWNNETNESQFKGKKEWHEWIQVWSVCHSRHKKYITSPSSCMSFLTFSSTVSSLISIHPTSSSCLRLDDDLSLEPRSFQSSNLSSFSCQWLRKNKWKFFSVQIPTSVFSLGAWFSHSSSSSSSSYIKQTEYAKSYICCQIRIQIDFWFVSPTHSSSLIFPLQFFIYLHSSWCKQTSFMHSWRDEGSEIKNRIENKRHRKKKEVNVGREDRCTKTSLSIEGEVTFL